MKICYFRNSQVKYIHLQTPEEAVAFLKNNRIIHHLSCWRNGELNMYDTALQTTANVEGAPVQTSGLVRVEWADINLSRQQVITMSAWHEIEKDLAIRRFIAETFRAA